MADVARGAGMEPPAFYAHFKNAEECMEVVAREMFDRGRQRQTDGRRFMFQQVDYNAAGEGPDYFYPHVRAALRGWIKERRVSEIFLRCRYDDSPMGKAIRQVLAQSRDDFSEDLMEMATRVGLSGRHLGQIHILAEQIMSISLNAAESLLEGRQRDVDRVAALLARSIYHMTRGEFVRLLEESRS